MGRKPTRITTIPVKGIDKYLVCVGGNLNGDGPDFHNVNVYLCDTSSKKPRDYRKGRLLTSCLEGWKCGYTGEWKLASSSQVALGGCETAFREHLEKNGGLF